MPASSSIRVLLVEDNSGDARLVREHLTDVHGGQEFTVEAVPTLAAALAALAASRPDIILLDLSLPDSFGLETLERWQRAAPDRPVIVLTGSDDEALAVAAVREGAQDYLVKGRIDGDLLAQAIRYAIERKRVQEDLRLVNDELERRVEARTAELRDSNLRLQNEIAERTLAQQQAAELLLREQESRRMVESANRSKDEFLAILSHELRTPLNAILGWSEILRSGEPDHAEVREGIEVIERNARSQARLVEDVLEVSRIVCGKVRLQLGPVDLSGVIDAALTSARPAAAAKSVSLRRIVDAMPVPIQGDADRLQQVVWNLLSNAIKFTPGGGVVTVHASQDHTHSVIEISDTGVGIKADFLPFVFDRFRQFDGSSTRSHGGLGLGLSITRHLVEMHRGHISAHSGGDGQGAAFTVLLPLDASGGFSSETDTSDVRSGRIERGAVPELPSLESCKVLVVDDEPDSRRVVVRLLSRAQAQVREADSVATALDVLGELERRRVDQRHCHARRRWLQFTQAAAGVIRGQPARVAGACARRRLYARKIRPRHWPPVSRCICRSRSSPVRSCTPSRRLPRVWTVRPSPRTDPARPPRNRPPGCTILQTPSADGWLPRKDSNLDKVIQSHLCYHYTTRHRRGPQIWRLPSGWQLFSLAMQLASRLRERANSLQISC